MQQKLFLNRGQGQI